MSLRTGEKQSFGTDQLPTQIGVLLALLYCLLFPVSSQNPFKKPLPASNHGVTGDFCLEIWIFFTFLLRPLKKRKSRYSRDGNT